MASGAPRIREYMAHRYTGYPPPEEPTIKSTSGNVLIDMSLRVITDVPPFEFLIFLRQIVFTLSANATLIIVSIYSHIIKHIVVIIEIGRDGLFMILDVLPPAGSASI